MFAGLARALASPMAVRGGMERGVAMADIFFAAVTVIAFALLIAFVYACDRL